MRGLLILLGVATIVMATFVLLTRKRSGKKKGVTNATDEPFKMPKSMLGWFPIIFPFLFGAFIATMYYMFVIEIPNEDIWSNWFTIVLAGIVCIGLWFFYEQIPKTEPAKEGDGKDKKGKKEVRPDTFRSLAKDWGWTLIPFAIILFILAMKDHVNRDFKQPIPSPTALAATMPKYLPTGRNFMQSKVRMAIELSPTLTFSPDPGKTITLRLQKGNSHYDLRISNTNGTIEVQVLDYAWDGSYGTYDVWLLGPDDFVTYKK